MLILFIATILSLMVLCKKSPGVMPGVYKIQLAALWWPFFYVRIVTASHEVVERYLEIVETEIRRGYGDRGVKDRNCKTCRY